MRPLRAAGGRPATVVGLSMGGMIAQELAIRHPELVSALAEEVCWETDPACASCPIVAECPTGQEATAGATPAARAGRSKPR